MPKYRVETDEGLIYEVETDDEPSIVDAAATMAGKAVNFPTQIAPQDPVKMAQSPLGKAADTALGAINPSGVKPTEIPETIERLNVPRNQTADAIKRPINPSPEPSIRAYDPKKDEGTIRGRTTIEKLLDDPLMFITGVNGKKIRPFTSSSPYFNRLFTKKGSVRPYKERFQYFNSRLKNSKEISNGEVFQDISAISKDEASYKVGPSILTDAALKQAAKRFSGYENDMFIVFKRMKENDTIKYRLHMAKDRAKNALTTDDPMIKTVIYLETKLKSNTEEIQRVIPEPMLKAILDPEDFKNLDFSKKRRAGTMTDVEAAHIKDFSSFTNQGNIKGMQTDEFSHYHSKLSRNKNAPIDLLLPVGKETKAERIRVSQKKANMKRNRVTKTLLVTKEDGATIEETFSGKNQVDIINQALGKYKNAKINFKR